ncbi:MAG: FAD:protein FMN transferase [Oscillospiraceae bacterium]|nr:FAD:protein FMN transferase [Oscillospiraceae bacterium]
MVTITRNIIKITALCLMLAALCSCAPKYARFEESFTGEFDTYTVIVGYAHSKKEFDGYVKIIRDRLLDLHQKYDIYNSYEGINNIKTINENAGISPVAVDKDIIELLKFGKQAYDDTNGAVNIALGPVLRIWHSYRNMGLEDPENAKLPPVYALRDAAELSCIDGLLIDEVAGTAYLTEKGMSLDVGAVAKGFAVQLAVNDAKEAGMTFALVNAGGDVVSVGGPRDGIRERWAIGVQDPIKGGQDIFDTVYVNDASIATSGNYQRYYTVGGKRYNHIIDTETLMPAERFASVTVIAEGSGIADMLSTGLFILPVDEGKAILSKAGGEAVWIHHDGTAEMTPGYEKISKTFGGLPHESSCV